MGNIQTKLALCDPKSTVMPNYFMVGKRAIKSSLKNCPPEIFPTTNFDKFIVIIQVSEL